MTRIRSERAAEIHFMALALNIEIETGERFRWKNDPHVMATMLAQAIRSGSQELQWRAQRYLHLLHEDKRSLMERLMAALPETLVLSAATGRKASPAAGATSAPADSAVERHRTGSLGVSGMRTGVNPPATSKRQPSKRQPAGGQPLVLEPLHDDWLSGTAGDR